MQPAPAPPTHRRRAAAVTNGSQQNATSWSRSQIPKSVSSVFTFCPEPSEKQFPFPPQAGRKEANARKGSMNPMEPESQRCRGKSCFSKVAGCLCVCGGAAGGCWWTGPGDNQAARSPCLMIKGLRSLAAFIGPSQISIFSRFSQTRLVPKVLEVKRLQR